MARIVIVGSGVVGTATGRGFLHHGHAVEFIDIDARRIDDLRARGLAASDHIDLAGAPAFVFLTLPTPNRGNRFDLGSLAAGTAAVGHALRGSTSLHTIVVRSTVPPGTADDLVQPTLQRHSDLEEGDGYTVASNPEFLRAACALEDFLNPWMTVVASRSKRTVERLSELYRPFGGELETFDDPRVAEFIKCAHNIFNATKISFWNEMGAVAEQLGVDIRSVAETVSRSSEGSTNIRYGIAAGRPYGGACLPKDTRGFLGFAADVGVQADLLAATIEVNEKLKAPAPVDDSGSSVVNLVAGY